MFIKITLTLFLILSSLTANSKKGEKIYSILCDKKEIELLSYTSKEELTKLIKTKNLCSNIDEKKLQNVVEFLTQKEIKTIKIPKDAKCPICGMFVAKYPKWVTTIETKNSKIYYFDGIKDMMKYYLESKKPDMKILANDYYTTKPIDATKAWYVVGGDVYGPMGNELIAFKTKEDAKIFLNEHHGEKIVKFTHITQTLIYGLDN